MKILLLIFAVLFVVVLDSAAGSTEKFLERGILADHQYRNQRCVAKNQRCIAFYRNYRIQHPPCCSRNHVCRRRERGYGLYCLPGPQNTPGPTPSSSPQPASSPGGKPSPSPKATHSPKPSQSAGPAPSPSPAASAVPLPSANPSSSPAASPSVGPKPSSSPAGSVAPKPSPEATKFPKPSPTSPPSCNRVRKEISDVTDAEWKDYVEAVKTLHKQASAGGGNVYDDFTRGHGVDEFQWHGGQYFLPAHRQMLWEFETALQQIKPGVTIPYYDWSINHERWPFDPVWGRVGGADGGPIPKEPFRGWRSALPNDHLVTRLMVENSLTDGNGENVFSLESRDELDVAISLTSASFQEFATYVEIVHGLPHIAIGGDMEDGFHSPSDPVFYLHHSFVDKIWRDWQLAGARDKFDGLHRGSPVSINERMRPLRWGRSVREIMGQITSCVRYEEASRRPPRRAQFRTFGAASAQSEASAAETKAEDGAAYKDKVEEIKKSQDAFVKGATFSKLPQNIVATGLETKKKIQEITEPAVLASDIENPQSVLAKSDSAVEQEGRKQAVAAGSGSNSTAS